MIKMIWIFSMFLSLLFAIPSFGKIKIVETTKKITSSDTEAYLGRVYFLGFLRCADLLKSGQQKVETCVKNFMSSKLSAGRIKVYIETLSLSKEYTEPFYCNDKTKKMVKFFETEKHDFFLCFKTNINSPERESIVFFTNDGGLPRILKLKL